MDRLSPSARFFVACVAVASLASGGSEAGAQGVSTVSIHGRVRSISGEPLDRAAVVVRNQATGFHVVAESRDGSVLISGLEVGGPYSVVVALAGYHSERRDGIFLRLGETLDIEVGLRPVAIPLERLIVRPDATRPEPNADGGVATTIPGVLVHALPTPDRDFYDFIRLVPQVSTRIGFPSGLSGGGVGFRFNSFLINGVPERTAFANATPALGGGKSLPLEAVKEYQVLLAPYDVRYGDFAGALVNTITARGSNDFRASSYVYARNERLARGTGPSSSAYEMWQYGFSVGGPLVRDRLHFFVAPELQRFTEPAAGPFLGQPATDTPPLPVTEDVLVEADRILRGHGLEPGSAGPVENRSPLANVYARLDLAIPERASRVSLWHNSTANTRETFSRADPQTFTLASYQLTQDLSSHLTALQVHTALDRRGGGHNELNVSLKSEGAIAASEVDQPIVEILVPGTGGGLLALRSGTHELAQGGDIRASMLSAENTLTLPAGDVVLTLGAALQRFRIEREGVPGSYGVWSFPSLDDLRTGTAERYEIRRPVGGADPVLRGGQFAIYAGGSHPIGERLRLTLGARIDWIGFDDRAPYNPAVDSIFGRRTDRMPAPGPHVSPRLGFTWDVTGNGRDRVRGGVGSFAGRPPLAWFFMPLSSYGIGVGTLRCGPGPQDAGPPPAFDPDPADAPTACANGSGLTESPRGDVDLLDPRLGMARTLRASLAYDRELSEGLSLTLEALHTRNLADFVFTNLNLVGPAGDDAYGRVLYGTIDETGVATPNVRSDFAEVIDLVHTDRNRSWQLSARLTQRLSGRLAGSASYTLTDARDVQSALRTGLRGTVNWSSRAVSGRHDDPNPAASLNDVPHRVVLAVTWRAGSERWPTNLSLYWIGESGSPFTYRAWGTGRRGDLNADGSNANDPIYVPRSAFDPAEIRFSGRSELPRADNSPEAQAARVNRQRAAFERRVADTPCLASHRGRLLARNACREPWSNTTMLSVRQALPFADGALEAELDLFNVLNLLDGDWGRRRVALPDVLEHVGQSSGAPEGARPVFRFNPDAPEWSIDPAESGFQLQLGLRYRF